MQEFHQTLGMEVLLGKRLQFFDVPLCFVSKNNIPELRACLFLASVAVNSRSQTGDTTLTYAKNLLPWLQYFSSNEIDLSDASEQHLTAFRAELVRSEGLSSSAIRLRIQCACYFHIWGMKSNRMPTDLGQYLQARSEQKTADWRRSLSPPIEYKVPRYIGLSEWEKIKFAAPERWRLMFTWAICTGLRRAEICNLRLKDLEILAQDNDSTKIASQVNIVRKGGKRTFAYVPIELVRATQWWCDLERPKINPNSAIDHIFVNKRGRPIDRNQMSRAFRSVADRVGCKGTLHHLRHAFALMVLDWLPDITKEDSGVNPLKVLQELLGHSQQETSEKYLRAKRAYESAISAHLGQKILLTNA